MTRRGEEKGYGRGTRGRTLAVAARFALALVVHRAQSPGLPALGRYHSSGRCKIGFPCFGRHSDGGGVLLLTALAHVHTHISTADGKRRSDAAAGDGPYFDIVAAPRVQHNNIITLYLQPPETVSKRKLFYGFYFYIIHYFWYNFL